VLAFALVAPAVVGVACSAETQSGSRSGQPSSDAGDAGVIDPNCSSLTAHVRDDLPTGSCLRGAQCAFTNSPPHCPPGGGYKPVIANEYECSCAAGMWTCEITHGGLGVVPCPGGSDSAAELPSDAGDDGD
jgi:hypothetical protein